MCYRTLDEFIGPLSLAQGAQLLRDAARGIRCNPVSSLGTESRLRMANWLERLADAHEAGIIDPNYCGLGVT